MSVAPAGGRVGVVADDLIWASRLVTAVERAGAETARLGSERALATALEASSLAEPGEGAARLVGCVIDLNGRAYDGVAAVRACAAARLPVIAVGQHEDLLLRKRALEAGALRVFSYDKAFRDGAALVRTWLIDGHPVAAGTPG
jgi:CheY-like chemotaxis protein